MVNDRHLVQCYVLNWIAGGKPAAIRILFLPMLAISWQARMCRIRIGLEDEIL